jgi:hypothetical protein
LCSCCRDEAQESHEEDEQGCRELRSVGHCIDSTAS